MAYQPIENYGIIGDLHTVALIGMNGSIDFLPFPYFDSPTVFAALLDDQRGGRFELAPVLSDAHQKQIYLPDTNVLISRFLSHEGVAEVSDFMPLEETGHAHNLVRRIKCVRGEVPLPHGLRAPLRLRSSQSQGRAARRGGLVHLRGAGSDGPASAHSGSGDHPERRGGGGVHGARWAEPGLHPGGRPRAPTPPPPPPATCPSRSNRPPTTGIAGSPARPTRAAGARWSSARPWSSSC